MKSIVPNLIVESIEACLYGAREIIVRDPAGNVVAFASREAA